MKRVLIVDDEVAIAEPLIYVLEREGLAVAHVTLGAEALQRHHADPADLIVLDIGLPDGSGFDVLRALRAGDVAPEVPVLFLSARGDEIDRVLGLELGADDYVVKPFSPREVLARIKAILKRGALVSARADATGAVGGPGSQPGAAVSHWLHDVDAMQIRYQGVRLDLTRYEYGLLALLVSRPGKIFPRDAIMARVWLDAPDTADRTIDAHIKTLRAKLRAIRPDSDPIQTHRGLGYSVVDA